MRIKNIFKKKLNNYFNITSLDIITDGSSSSYISSTYLPNLLSFPILYFPWHFVSNQPINSTYLVIFCILTDVTIDQDQDNLLFELLT